MRSDPEVDKFLMACAGQIDDPLRAIRHARNFLRLARKQHLGTNETDDVQETLRGLEILPSSLVVAARPRDFTSAELREELNGRLTPEELVLAVNPLTISDEMKTWARELVVDVEPSLARALFLFDAIGSRVTVPGTGGSRTAQEVYAVWKQPEVGLSCQEYAKVYVALARELGLDAYYVHLERDARGGAVNHDCAALFFGGKAVLVDPTWRMFGVQHKEFVVLNDLQTIAHHACQPRDDGRQLDRVRVALKLHPELVWTQVAFGSALAESGEVDEAAQILRRIVTEHPGHVGALLAEALVAGQRGRFPDAVEGLEQVLSLDPDNFQAEFSLGNAFLQLRQTANAREHLEKALALEERVNFPGQVEFAQKTLRQLDEVQGAQGGDQTLLAALRQRAEHGEAQAQHNLAVILFSTPGPDNEVEAIRWLTRSAETGYAPAQVLVGGLYRKGALVARNDAVALQWFRKAALQGDAEGRYRLGLALYLGEGAAQDGIEAYYWLSLAAKVGHRDAPHSLKELELFLPPESLEKARKRLRTKAPKPPPPGPPRKN